MKDAHALFRRDHVDAVLHEPFLSRSNSFNVGSQRDMGCKKEIYIMARLMLSRLGYLYGQGIIGSFLLDASQMHCRALAIDAFREAASRDMASGTPLCRSHGYGTRKMKDERAACVAPTFDTAGIRAHCGQLATVFAMYQRTVSVHSR